MPITNQRPGQRHRGDTGRRRHDRFVTVTNPGSQTATVGTAASLQVAASDSASGQTLTYTASGLPAGLSINSSTGLISGTPTTAGTSSVTVTATDTTGAKGTATFSWTVSSGTGTGGIDISVGGPAAPPFVADEDYAGGATASVTTTGVANPAPQSVYQHNRYGNFTYTIPGLTAGASYLRHRRRGVQGGRRVVHRHRQQRRGGHHPVRHRQGQRPSQRHRDLASMSG